LGRIRWLGHASFEIELADQIVLVDPWLDGNPKAPIRASEIRKANVVCVTHDHGDHLGDAISICKQTGATFVGIPELSSYVGGQGVKNSVGINIGGTVEVNGIAITMVQAFHSCQRGAPTGFVIKGEGKTIYHAGDTGLFGDMKLIGEMHKPDPIGGYYTMDPEAAAKAVELIKPAAVIPMHYQTFPVLVSSPEEFVRLVKERAPKTKVIVLKPGETYQI